MATVKRRLRRRGGGGPDGTAGASRAVDLSHQTLAKPETRRDSAEAGGCSAAAWRSGARRLNRAAGQEPKGASALLFFVIRVLVMVVFVVFSGKFLIGFQSRHATPRHATPRHATQVIFCDNLPSATPHRLPVILSQGGGAGAAGAGTSAVSPKG
ncbi:hypothetical protein JTF19_19660 [Enterobacteriaceae bacterium RIT814]|nr:hypothetical protein [Enterobacteriaceae bacterium RIT 814]